MPEKYYDIPGFFGAIKPLRFEADVHDLEILGEVPAELRGRFYRCGPVHQYPTLHNDNIINGDGLISAFRIENGHVDFSCRYVRTERYEMERKARRRLYGTYRNPYSDDPSTIGTDRDNTANTNAIVHHGRLFALREDSHPYEIDPDTLATRGPWDFGGKLTSKAVTAHPKFDPRTGEWWSIGYFARGDVTEPDMCLQVISASGALTREEWFKAPFPGIVHDFGLTQEHVIFPVMPMTTSIERMRAGGDFYAYDPGLPCCYGIMPRTAHAREVRWFKKKAAFSGHVMNAFSAGTQVHLDATISRGNGFAFYKDINGHVTDPADGVATVSRLTFDLQSPSEGFEVAPFAGAVGEMPTCDPRFVTLPYRHGFMMQPGGVARLDWKLGALAVHRLEGAIAGEPIFVPRARDAADGEGFVLAVVTRFRENRADLIILDAQHMEREPLAVAVLPFNAPKAFHGSWVALP